MSKLHTEILKSLREENDELRQRLEKLEAKDLTADALQSIIGTLYKVVCVLGPVVAQSKQGEAARERAVAMLRDQKLPIPHDVRKRRRKRRTTAAAVARNL